MAQWISDLTAFHSNAVKGPTLSQKGNSDSAPRRVESPGQRINQTFTIVFSATNVPQQCQPFSVPPGCKVKARAFNGTVAGNANPVYVASNPGTLLNGQGTALAPLDNLDFPADHTSRLWAMGTSGDGVVISIVSQD